MAKKGILAEKHHQKWDLACQLKSITQKWDIKLGLACWISEVGIALILEQASWC
jgi:hypothetical protein